MFVVLQEFEKKPLVTSSLERRPQIQGVRFRVRDVSGFSAHALYGFSSFLHFCACGCVRPWSFSLVSKVEASWFGYLVL